MAGLTMEFRFRDPVAARAPVPGSILQPRPWETKRNETHLTTHPDLSRAHSTDFAKDSCPTNRARYLPSYRNTGVIHAT